MAARVFVVVALLPIFGFLFFATYMTLGMGGIPGISSDAAWFWGFLNYVLPVSFVLGYLTIAWRLFRRGRR